MYGPGCTLSLHACQEGDTRQGKSLDIPVGASRHPASPTETLGSLHTASHSRAGGSSSYVYRTTYLLHCRPPQRLLSLQWPSFPCATCWLVLALEEQVHSCVPHAAPGLVLSPRLLGGYSCNSTDRTERGLTPSQKQKPGSREPVSELVRDRNSGPTVMSSFWLPSPVLASVSSRVHNEWASCPSETPFFFFFFCLFLFAVGSVRELNPGPSTC